MVLYLLYLLVGEVCALIINDIREVGQCIQYVTSRFTRDAKKSGGLCLSMGCRSGWGVGGRRSRGRA